MKKSVMFF